MDNTTFSATTSTATATQTLIRDWREESIKWLAIISVAFAGILLAVAFVDIKPASVLFHLQHEGLRGVFNYTWTKTMFFVEDNLANAIIIAIAELTIARITLGLLLMKIFRNKEGERLILKKAFF